MIIEGKGQQTVVQDGGRLLLVVATPEMKLTWPGLRTGVMSEIISGKRQLNVRQIKLLSERFKVSPVRR